MRYERLQSAGEVSAARRCGLQLDRRESWQLAAGRWGQKGCNWHLQVAIIMQVATYWEKDSNAKRRSIRSDKFNRFSNKLLGKVSNEM